MDLGPNSREAYKGAAVAGREAKADDALFGGMVRVDGEHDPIAHLFMASVGARAGPRVIP